MDEPRISIVVPVYNVRDHLERCISSLKAQTLTDFEVIMVDDGSTDGSVGVCEHFVANDDRFKILTQSNMGVSNARNRAIRVARGEYLMFIDADDFIEPAALELMASRLDETGADACLCDSYYRGDSVRALPDIIRFSDKIDVEEVLVPHLAMRFVSALWVFMFRTSTVRHLLFEEKLHQMEDWDYILQFITRAHRIATCHDPLYHNVIREGSASYTPLNERVMTCLLLPALATAYVDTSRPDMKNAVDALESRLVLKLLGMFSKTGSTDPRYERGITLRARANLPQALRNPMLSVKERAFLSLASVGPLAYARVFKAIHGVGESRTATGRVACGNRQGIVTRAGSNDLEGRIPEPPTRS